MMEYIGDRLAWDANIAQAADHWEQALRGRATEREQLFPFATNVPSMIEARRIAYEEFDQATQVMQWRASAARDGHWWYDDDTPFPHNRGANIKENDSLRQWFKMAKEAGRLVEAKQYFKSRHSFTNQAPLKVRRGEPSGQFGRNEPGTSPLGFNTTRR